MLNTKFKINPGLDLEDATEYELLYLLLTKDEHHLGDNRFESFYNLIKNLKNPAAQPFKGLRVLPSCLGLRQLDSLSCDLMNFETRELLLEYLDWVCITKLYGLDDKTIKVHQGIVNPLVKLNTKTRDLDYAKSVVGDSFSDYISYNSIGDNRIQLMWGNSYEATISCKNTPDGFEWYIQHKFLFIPDNFYDKIFVEEKPYQIFFETINNIHIFNAFTREGQALTLTSIGI